MPEGLTPKCLAIVEGKETKVDVKKGPGAVPGWPDWRCANKPCRFWVNLSNTDGPKVKMSNRLGNRGTDFVSDCEAVQYNS
jgi:hypothetical protein